MTQLPPATYALLETLKSAHTNLFPVQTLNQFRPDTSDDDSDQGRILTEQRIKLSKAVLGGWMRALEGEEGKNGAHSTRFVIFYFLKNKNCLFIFSGFFS